MNELDAKAKEIFLEAVEQPTPDRLDSFLDGACGGNPALRARVEALLKAHREAGNFLGGASPEQTGMEGPATERAGAVIGPYQLVEQIGAGGFGVVFRADQQRPVRRHVALKVLKPGMDTRQVVARFEAERQALALMDHPNIAHVLDGGETASGRPYFVMDLVQGKPITQYCDENHLTPKERLELFVPVCQAVQHAHQKGIIHRDLKPSNVLVALYDGKPVPKVIDFGVAKAIGPKPTEGTLTEQGALIGTPEYMSPEQAEPAPRDIDTRSDIYALGVLLYELLTGTTPLDRGRSAGVGLLELLRRIRDEEPPTLSTRLSTVADLPTIAVNRGLEPKRLQGLVRGELDWIVMKALEKDRNRRYETATGLAQDVRRYLDDEPVQACPPSAVYRLRKFARRHQGRLAVAAGVFLAVTVMAASIGWAVRDRTARQAEIEQAEAARRTKVEAQVRDSLNLARALIAENRLASARERLAQARAQLGNDGPALGNLAAEVEAGAAELDRFQQFLDRIERAHEAEAVTLSPGVPIPSKAWPRQSAAAVPLRLEALKCYGILERDDWNSALEAGFLGEHQLEQIRQLTYEELLWLADDIIRRPEGHPSEEKLSPNAAAQKALAYLSKAESARRPTRALYGLRARCRKTLVGEEAAQADTQRAAQTSATIALDHFLEGKAAYDAQQLAEGVQAFEAALRVEPTHYWSLMWLGFCLYDLGQGPADFAGAARVFTGCILRRPDHSYAYSARAACYLKLRRFTDAVADCSRAIELDPELVPAWNARGLACWRADQPDKALADISRAIELDPTNARAWHNRGFVYNKLGQPGKALPDLSRAIELDPMLVSAWNERGLAYWWSGQHDNALADLSRAIELEPKLVPGWNNRGIVYNKLGQHEKALADLSRAIELDPKHVAAWTERGLAYWRSGQPDKALADYSRAIELDPKHAPAWHNRGELYALLGQPDKALADLSRAIELAPNDPRLVEAYRLRALAHRRLGHFAQARTDYETFLRHVPARAEAYNDLAWLLATCPDAKLREPHRAVESAQKAVQLAPKDGAYWNTLGVAYYRAGDWKKAVTALEKSLELSPDESVAENSIFLAMAHWQLGDKDHARQWYHKAAAWADKNRPADPELKQFRSEASQVLNIAPATGPATTPNK